MTDGSRAPRGAARERLLAAAVDVIRTRGYAATTVDDLCRAAGVTKGAFFHHFASKQALAIAAAEHWAATTSALFASAPYHLLTDARDRVLGYVDFRHELVDGAPAEFTCLVGTMAQEVFASDPELRNACAASIFDHAATLEADLAEALASSGTDEARRLDPGALARHVQAVLQGAFVVGKAAYDAATARESIEHLRRYLELLMPARTRTSRDRHV